MLEEELSIPRGGIYGLVSNMGLATKIVQTAKAHHCGVRNFDKAEALIQNARDTKPFLVILDCDGCEAEAFRVLSSFRLNSELSGIPVVGCVSQAKRALRDEAEKAGCLRVYLKTEFFRNLDDLILRYAK